MNPGLLAGACLCALLSSFAAEAGTTKTRPLIGGHGDNVEAFVSQHDDNADGRLTWAEFDAFRRNRFDVTDSNGDGTVDVEEYVQQFDDRLHRALEAGRAEQDRKGGVSGQSVTVRVDLGGRRSHTKKKK